MPKLLTNKFWDEDIMVIRMQHRIKNVINYQLTNYSL